MSNRIWIELDKPENDKHADEMCDLANKMLTKMGIYTSIFWWSSMRQTYNFGDSSGYEELIDRGHWFNLDYLGK